MMDENVYVAPDGKRYRVEERPGCIGCHFFITEGGCEESRNHGRAPCIGRADHRSVIWVPDDAPAPMAELTAEPAFPGTLRDWFAGMALMGWTAKYAGAGASVSEIAVSCYHRADAMMNARDEARP
jgi:hypothetical protein